jgi:hypothetical protein
VSESDTPALSLQEQLERAARDLWTMQEESGPTYIVFMDRRRLSTRVDAKASDEFAVSWQSEDGSWITYEKTFDNAREAAFHGYQGPH